MKKGQIIEGVVERVDFPNKGIVNTAEGICTVKNVLPGQKITLMVQKNRNKKAEAFFRRGCGASREGKR